MAKALTLSEAEDKLRAKINQLKADLDEAGSPASLTVECFGGGLAGWGVTRGLYKVLDMGLKVKEGEVPGRIKRNAEFTKGCIAGSLGLLTGVANLMVPYKYPLSYPRGMALQGSITMLTSGLDRIVDHFPAAPAAAAPAAMQPASK